MVAYFWYAIAFLPVLLVALSGHPLHPQQPHRHRGKALEPQRLGQVRLHRPARRGRLPARRAARRPALSDAAPVRRAHRPAGDHHAGQDRLCLCPRRPAAGADADAGLERRRQRLSGCGRAFCAPAASAARSAASCAKAPTPSTWCSSWSSPRSGSTACPSAARMRQVIRAWPRSSPSASGFRPVVIKDTDDLVGIVTVHDGPSLPQGEIIAPMVGDDAARRRDLPQQLPGPRPLPARRRPARPPAAGAGRRHLLYQPPVCHRGDDPQDDHRGGHGGRGGLLHRRDRARTSRATDYRHGELVHRGQRGVWSEPLLPGKYAFNTYAGKVVSVPTTNIILKWIRSQVGLAPPGREPERGLADHQGRL